MARDRDEPVRLTKIYTRGGDAGETSLGDGSRVSKLDERIAAYGASDELNSAIGVVLAADVPASHRATCSCASRTSCSTSAPTSPSRVEHEGRLRVTQDQVDRLEADCDRFNADLPELKSFVLPGGERGGGAAARRAGRVPASGAGGARRGRGSTGESAGGSCT